MSGVGASGFFEALRDDLRPTPERFAKSAFTAIATTTAVAIAVALQNGSFVAVLVGYMALQPNVVCTWRNMVRRIANCAVAAALFLPFAGVLIQLPWLLVPTLFVLVTAILYFAPMTARPIESLGLLFVAVMTPFTGVLQPESMASGTLELVCGFAIGVVVATVFSEIRGSTHPHDLLTASLAASFASARSHLATVAARWRAPTFTPIADKTTFDTDLTKHLQLYELVRQEAPPFRVRRALLTFMNAAARCHSFVDTLDVLSRESCGREYRRKIDREIGDLVEAIDAALVQFGRVAACIDRVAREEARPDPPPEWPRFEELVGAVRGRQLELRHAGALGAIGMAEAENGHAFVQGLTGVGDVLRVPPEELAHLASGESEGANRAMLPTLNPYALRYAAQAALATTLSFLCGVLANVPELITALFTVLFIAQSSYGATLRRAELRLAGVVIGGVLALAAMISVFPNVETVGALLLLFFPVVFFGHYVALGGARFAYAGVTTIAVFAMALTATRPLTEVDFVLWRVFATFLGVVSLFTVFRLVAPDYAGRQLVARLRDVLAIALALLPPWGTPPPAFHRRLALQRELARAQADLLRLADETRLEGEGSGVDTRAAVDAAGLATRIALRCGQIARGRDARWPQLTPATAENLSRAVAAARAHIELLHELLDTRHTMARPGSRAHATAREAAAAVAARRRPDIDGALAALDASVDRARFTELTDWRAEEVGLLFAEIAHLHRLARIVPSLDGALLRTLLPELTASDPHAEGSLALGPAAT